jgi:SAM-dependent methyltransferase
VPKTLGARLRKGLDLADDDFDVLYPNWARDLSRIHWTPVAVAHRAATLLVARPGTRVLDVGSGVGKFAIVGSLATEGVFCGIEQIRTFVEVARATAKNVGTKTAQFLHGNMMTLDWSTFDAFYLYNPFLESLERPEDPTDVEPELVRAYVQFVRERLHVAAPGTRVVTYHGFGGALPRCYQLEVQEPCGTDVLELWVKGREQT